MANANPNPPPAKQNLEEQNIDRMIAEAVKAAARGENVDQLLVAMLGLLPDSAKDKVTQKFSAALKQRKLRQPSTEKTDTVIARSALGRLQDMLSATMRQAADKIAALVRSKPDVAQNIQQAANILIKNGVKVDSVQISEADLGYLSPQKGMGQAPVKEGGRNV